MNAQKVVAVSASPVMERGNTALILNPFLEGMREAGADVELLYTRQLNIEPCRGEFHCWFREPGQCMLQDDMQKILPKLADADIWVLATPVYVDGIAGPLKNLLDRVLPLVQPFFELRDGHCRHPRREGVKAGKVVLVANCGFWELDNFDPLIMHIQAMCRNASREFAAALLRPHGPALRLMLRQNQPVQDVIDAAMQAGEELIQTGKIHPETLQTISRELLPLAIYVDLLNQSFENALEAA